MWHQQAWPTKSALEVGTLKLTPWSGQYAKRLLLVWDHYMVSSTTMYIYVCSEDVTSDNIAALRKLLHRDLWRDLSELTVSYVEVAPKFGLKESKVGNGAKVMRKVLVLSSKQIIGDEIVAGDLPFGYIERSHLLKATCSKWLPNGLPAVKIWSSFAPHAKTSGDTIDVVHVGELQKAFHMLGMRNMEALRARFINSYPSPD